MPIPEGELESVLSACLEANPEAATTSVAGRIEHLRAKHLL
jgi:hypothetical protein